jgi:hypothetical protein
MLVIEAIRLVHRQEQGHGHRDFQRLTAASLAFKRKKFFTSTSIHASVPPNFGPCRVIEDRNVGSSMPSQLKGRVNDICGDANSVHR